ncbi:hypothetical protein [Paenibacillus cremeus]|uniref:hypothetical protein n=1 Tax=Paenibacillus cremeus TaxID=2163881 RepID=UPI001644770C|nr:hypothetical protein [Paenibacillus cremeus]
MFNEPHLIAREAANHALDGGLTCLKLLRIAKFLNAAGDCVLHKALGIARNDAEFHPVGATIGAEIRFILHFLITSEFHFSLVAVLLNRAAGDLLLR